MADHRMPVNASVSEQARYWVMRLHSGECTEQDKIAIVEWLALSEEHRCAYEASCATWDGIEALKFAIPQEIEAARIYKHSVSHNYVPMAAAAVFLLLVIPLYLWMFLGSESIQSFSTQRMEQKHIALPDGSSIELGTQTKLEVKFTRSARIIQFEYGEAFFTVNKNDTRPFDVLAGNGRIRDIGTRFNVHSKENVIFVTVTEGIVDISTEYSRLPLRLTAGQQISYSSTGEISPVKRINSETVTAWRDGLLVFSNDTLGEVAEEISHYHDVKILIDDPDLQRMKISGTFNADNLDSLLKALRSILPMRIYVKDGNTIIFSRRDDQGG